MIGDDDYPYGLMMPGRTFTAGQETREGYTGHELDAETGMYYAGARYYMPALARWTAVDPLTSEYPSLSAYNYVANNPLLLVDPDGREIRICIEENHCHTYEVGQQYDGDSVEIAVVVAHLNFLAFVDNDLHTIIDFLSGVDDVHTITLTNYGDGGIPGMGRGDGSRDSRIQYDPFSFFEHNGNDKSHPLVVLAHELSHSLDRQLEMGRRDRRLVNGIPINEIRAVQVENIVRDVLGGDRRTTYYVGRMIMGREVPNPIPRRTARKQQQVLQRNLDRIRQMQ